MLIKKEVVSEEVEDAMKEKMSVKVDESEMWEWIVPAASRGMSWPSSFRKEDYTCKSEHRNRSNSLSANIRTRKEFDGPGMCISVPCESGIQECKMYLTLAQIHPSRERGGSGTSQTII